jgi:hypothetical protein
LSLGKNACVGWSSRSIRGTGKLVLYEAALEREQRDEVVADPVLAAPDVLVEPHRPGGIPGDDGQCDRVELDAARSAASERRCPANRFPGSALRPRVLCWGRAVLR